MEDDSHAETENIIVHAYDWKVRDKFGDDDNVNIHCWALNRDSEPCLLRFTDFPAFCHLELPSVVRNHKYVWDRGNTDEFMRMLSFRLGDDAPTRYTFKMSKKTYYYRGDRKYPMLQLCFSNLAAMQHCANLLANPLKTDNWGFIKCNVWEDRISIVRKLLTVRDVRFSQWFSINARRVAQDSKIATIQNEYTVDWDSMTAVSPDESKYWTSKPGILAFDIECYSHNHRAMPDKYNSKDVAYMISCIYQKSTQPNTRKRYGILIGECGHIPPDKLANCEIIKVETEYQMIEAFARVTNETDPDVLTGYNIFGFDYPYLDHRVRRGLKKWPCMSRIIGETPVVSSKQWKSGAYGHQSINILETEGRISIDLLPVIKREHTRLQKYTLDHVCSKFIGKTKHDVKASEMFLIYENMRTTLTQLVSILREAQDNPELVHDAKYIRRASDAQAAFDEAKANTTRVMEYCIQDSELVIDLMEKLNIWTGLVEMSNIVGVTIVELFTRGQQVRCMSQLYDLASRKGFVIDARDIPGHGFKGGFVFDPVPGLYDNVICLDFSSLYPSIIRAFNIDYTTLVPPELEDTVPDDDCNIIEFDQDEVVEGAEDEDEEEFLTEIKSKKSKQVKTVLKHYRFKYYKHQKGLLPMLVENLVNERRAVNRTLAQTKDWIKADEKTEEVLAALMQYVNGTIVVMSIQDAKQHLEDLSNVKPAPSPDAIRGAKKSLAIAQLFDLEAARKRLTEACEAKPPTHPKLLEEAELEVQVSEYLASRNQEAIAAKIQTLNDTHQQRIERIASNKVMCVVFDKRQLALKVTANSFFGFLGIRDGGQMPLIEGAMSITATGRRLIGEVREYIERQYGGKQIYGDTDSVMVTLPQIKETKECNYWGLRLAQEITGIKPGEIDCDKVLWPEGRPGLFPSPLGMEFEKAMRLLCFKPKMYAALLIGKDGNFKVEEQLDKNGDVVSTQLAMLLKGIILARRDNCKFLRDTYMAILIMVMNRKSIDTALTYLIGRIQDLLSGKIPYTDLSIIRELGSNYKSESFFMKVFADELKKAGKFVNPGDRLDFVIVEDPTAALLGQKMKLVEQFSESLETPTPHKIDYMYYIEHALMNPINSLFRVGFKDDIAQLQHMGYRPSNRHKTIYLDRPMQIILKMRQKGYDLDVFKKAVIFNVEQLRNPPEPVPLKLHVVKPEELQPKPAEIQLKVEPQLVKLNIVKPAVSIPTTPHLVLPRFAMRQAPVLTLNVTPK